MERRGLIGVLALAGGILWRQNAVVNRGLLATVGVVFAVWAVAQPHELFPRMLVWLVPGVAVLVARTVAARRAAAIPAAIAVCAMAWSLGDGYLDDPLPVRQVAATVDGVQRVDGTACALDQANWFISAYTSVDEVAESVAAASRCDVLVLAGASNSPAELDEARAMFGHCSWLRGAEGSLIVLCDRSMDDAVPLSRTACRTTESG